MIMKDRQTDRQTDRQVDRQVDRQRSISLHHLHTVYTQGNKTSLKQLPKIKRGSNKTSIKTQTNRPLRKQQTSTHNSRLTIQLLCPTRPHTLLLDNINKTETLNRSNCKPNKAKPYTSQITSNNTNLNNHHTIQSLSCRQVTISLEHCQYEFRVLTDSKVTVENRLVNPSFALQNVISARDYVLMIRI